MNGKNHSQRARNKEESIISDRLLNYHPKIVDKKINCQYVRDCLYADKPGLALTICNAYIPGVQFEEDTDGDSFVARASFICGNERYEFAGRNKRKKLAKNDAAIYVVAWFFPYFLDESFADYCIRKMNSLESFVPPLGAKSNVPTAPVRENISQNLLGGSKEYNINQTMRVKGNGDTPNAFFDECKIKEIIDTNLTPCYANLHIVNSNLQNAKNYALILKAKSELPKNKTYENICSAAKNFSTVEYSSSNTSISSTYDEIATVIDFSTVECLTCNILTIRKKPATVTSKLSTVEYSPSNASSATYNEIATANNFSTVESTSSISTTSEKPVTVSSKLSTVEYSPSNASSAIYEEIATVNNFTTVDYSTGDISTAFEKPVTVSSNLSTVEYSPSNISTSTNEEIATVNNFTTVDYSTGDISTAFEKPVTVSSKLSTIEYSPSNISTSTNEEIATVNNFTTVDYSTGDISTTRGQLASLNKSSSEEYLPSNISRISKETATETVNTFYTATTEHFTNIQNDVPEQANASNVGDIIHSLVHNKFKELEQLKEYSDYLYDFDMLAGIVLVRTNNYKKGEVVAIGTGNRTISSQLISDCGDVVHDSHAEIICLRTLRKYFYSQLDLLISEPDESIFARSKNASFKYALRSDVAFHLYINSTPCGDARVYCEQMQKKAIKKSRGLLRIKSFATNAGTLNTSLQDRMLTLRAVREGIENFTTATCSDKLARTNVLGVQGAILCHIIEPIYLNSLTIGRLYDYEHLSRAINDRVRLSQDDKCGLSTKFRNNIVSLYRASNEKPAYYSTSTSKYSLNWHAGAGGVEVVVCSKGKTLDGEPSRLCKLELFKLFVSHCRRQSKKNENTPLTYGQCKMFCENYQLAKNILYQHFRSTGKGWWIVKHPEWDNFRCDILTA